MGFGLGSLGSVGKIVGGSLGFSGASILGSTALGLGQDFLDFGQDLELQNRNMDFQKDMYRNRYQYTVNDMKKAGLNPMLAYTHGAGGGIGNAGQGNSSSVSSASQVGLNMMAQTKLLNAQAENVKADTDLKRDQGGRERATTDVAIPAAADRDSASAGQSRQQVENLKAEIPRISAMINSLNAGASLDKMREYLTSLDAERLRSIMPALKSLAFSQAAGAEYGLPALKNKSDFASILQEWLYGPAHRHSGEASSSWDKFKKSWNDFQRQDGASGKW